MGPLIFLEQHRRYDRLDLWRPSLIKHACLAGCVPHPALKDISRTGMLAFESEDYEAPSEPPDVIRRVLFH